MSDLHVPEWMKFTMDDTMYEWQWSTAGLIVMSIGSNALTMSADAVELFGEMMAQVADTRGTLVVGIEDDGAIPSSHHLAHIAVVASQAIVMRKLRVRYVPYLDLFSCATYLSYQADGGGHLVFLPTSDANYQRARATYDAWKTSNPAQESAEGMVA